MVVDLTNKNISGKEAETRLATAGLLVSRSTIPADPRPPYNPSGIRIGTPAITTRGFKPVDMKNLAQLIDNKQIDSGNLKSRSEIQNGFVSLGVLSDKTNRMSK